MSAIFDNAVDSLKVGIGIWLGEDSTAAPKHAILNIFHAIELLLKERLHREHAVLIYKDLDRPITDSSPTVGLNEIIVRFQNLGVGLSAADAETLREFKRRRNRIEHHSFSEDPSHNTVIARALRFVFYFLRDQLLTSLEEVLENDEQYDMALQEILDYEEQLREAISEVEALTSPRCKDDLLEMPERAYCPQCGVDAVVIDGPRGVFCYLCRESVELERCPMCGEYVDAAELEHGVVCSTCEEWRN